MQTSDNMEQTWSWVVMNPEQRSKTNKMLIIGTALGGSLVIVATMCVIACTAVYAFRAQTAENSWHALALGLVSLCALVLIAKTLIEIFVTLGVVDTLFDTPGLRAGLCGAIRASAHPANPGADRCTTDQHQQFNHCTTGKPVAHSACTTGVGTSAPHATPEKGQLAAPGTSMDGANITDSPCYAASQLAHSTSVSYTRQ